MNMRWWVSTLKNKKKSDQFHFRIHEYKIRYNFVFLHEMRSIYKKIKKLCLLFGHYENFIGSNIIFKPHQLSTILIPFDTNSTSEVNFRFRKSSQLWQKITQSFSYNCQSDFYSKLSVTNSNFSFPFTPLLMYQMLSERKELWFFVAQMT